MADKFLILLRVYLQISLSKAIDIAINLIFENSPNIKFTKLELQKSFRIATPETHFTFNGSIFDQIDSVAMGFPLAPALANIFICFYEQNWIEQAFHKRYMDDIFAVFESQSEPELL